MVRGSVWVLKTEHSAEMDQTLPLDYLKPAEFKLNFLTA